MRFDKSRVDLDRATKIDRGRGVVPLVKGLITLLQEFLLLDVGITMAANGENGKQEKGELWMFFAAEKDSGLVWRREPFV